MSSATKARAICMHKARYSTQEKAQDVLALMERTKVNPGALGVFACSHCDGWHLGTRFGPSPRSSKPKRRRAGRVSVPVGDHQTKEKT